jgi:hypothetical protein
MPNAFSIDHLAARQQALANEDASAWLTVSPAWPENRMNNAALRTAFQRDRSQQTWRNSCFGGIVLSLRERDGVQMDRLTSRIYCQTSRRANGVEIQRIYQQIAVEFQTARANRVYITRNRFVPSPTSTTKGTLTPRGVDTIINTM